MHEPSRVCCADCLSRGSPCARSASWVEEMNAELAEFDALTATALDDSLARVGWETDMDAELEGKLATPKRDMKV